MSMLFIDFNFQTYSVDECSNNTNLCDNGQCLNLAGSFSCDCMHK